MKSDRLFETGIEEIDKEHQELHRLVQLLRDASRTGNGDGVQREIVRRVLSQVSEFSRHHFAEEERLMLLANYPDYTLHKNEHDLFLERMEFLQGSLCDGRVTLSVETLNALENWLFHHVNGTDRQYVPYLLKSGPAKDGKISIADAEEVSRALSASL